MRLKPEKVEYLSKKIVKNFTQLKKLQMIQTPEQVEGAVRRIITADLQREDELEREAEAILKQYRQKIDLQNMSYITLVNKTKQALARKRKIIL